MFDQNFSEALSIEQPLNSAQPPNSAQIAGYQILHYWGRRLYSSLTLEKGETVVRMIMCIRFSHPFAQISN